MSGQVEAVLELEEGEQVSELCQFRGLIKRAAQALGVDRGADVWLM